MMYSSYGSGFGQVNTATFGWQLKHDTRTERGDQEITRLRCWNAAVRGRTQIKIGDVCTQFARATNLVSSERTKPGGLPCFERTSSQSPTPRTTVICVPPLIRVNTRELSSGSSCTEVDRTVSYKPGSAARRDGGTGAGEDTAGSRGRTGGSCPAAGRLADLSASRLDSFASMTAAARFFSCALNLILKSSSCAALAFNSSCACASCSSSDFILPCRSCSSFSLAASCGARSLCSFARRRDTRPQRIAKVLKPR